MTTDRGKTRYANTVEFEEVKYFKNVDEAEWFTVERFANTTLDRIQDKGLIPHGWSAEVITIEA
jgi:hypothetical protein